MAAADNSLEVFVFKGGRFLGSRCYSQQTLVIGRGSEAALRLRDSSVSETHAVVRVEDGSVIIADNNSTQGVYVNSDRITTRVLSSFDEVAIGPFRLKFSLLGARQSDPGFGGEESQMGYLPTTSARAPAQTHSDEFDDPATTLHRRPSPEVPTVAERRLGPPSGGHDDTLPAQPLLGGRAQPSKQPASPRDYAPAAAAETVGTATAAALAMPAEPEFAPAQQPATGGATPWDRRDSRPDAATARVPQEPSESDADDDDDDDFVESFSLLENIVRERFRKSIDAEDYEMIEVIRYQNGEILDLLRANPGRSLRVGVDDFRLIHAQKSGRAQLFFKKGFSGTVVCRGKARPLKSLTNDRYLVNSRREIYGVELSSGDYAQIVRDRCGYLVRFVQPPRLPKPKLRMSLSMGHLQMFAGSAAFHFLILVLLGFIAPEAELDTVTDAERFAKIALKDLKLEKPKEPEKPKEEPKPPPAEDKAPKPKAKPKPTRRRAPRPRRPQPKASPKPAAPPREAVQRKQVKNVLSALQNLKPGAQTGRTDLKALSSNIRALRTPAGTVSDFKVSGAIRKLPGGGVRLAGLSGGKDTKVGSQLLRGRVGSLKARAGTGTRVRGRVRRAPTRAIAAKGGHLSREAIQQVVSRHMNQVQACYERQLITNPGLAGKIVFDWVISPSGSVSSARQVRSSVRSPAVSSCILALIRSWRFPKPVGGSVQVRYPFVFRVSGF